MLERLHDPCRVGPVLHDDNILHRDKVIPLRFEMGNECR